jgi:hypothetical protein
MIRKSINHAKRYTKSQYPQQYNKISGQQSYILNIEQKYQRKKNQRDLYQVHFITKMIFRSHHQCHLRSSTAEVGSVIFVVLFLISVIASLAAIDNGIVVEAVSPHKSVYEGKSSKYFHLAHDDTDGFMMTLDNDKVVSTATATTTTTTTTNPPYSWTTIERGGGLSNFVPAGYNPFGYKITELGSQFLEFDGSLDSDVGRFLASVKTTKRKRFHTIKEQWLEIVRVSKKGQSMRIYRNLEDLIAFCIKAKLLD